MSVSDYNTTNRRFAIVETDDGELALHSNRAVANPHCKLATRATIGRFAAFDAE